LEVPVVRSYRTEVRRQVKVKGVYGYYTVLSFVGRNQHGNLEWNCQCRCGALKRVLGSNLLGGANPSCGCYKTEVLVRRNYKHGLVSRPEHKAWCGIRQRCYNPRNQDYSHYGGRGIRVCDRWVDFAQFFADMGPMPTPYHTIERIDNNGDYEPGNCKWATRKEQNRNKRNIPLYDYRGRRVSVAELSELSGVPAGTLSHRLKRGMSAERAVLRTDYRRKPVR
jgi:hypothetical protein